MKNEMDIIDTHPISVPACIHPPVSTHVEKIQNVCDIGRSKEKDDAITERNCPVEISVNIIEQFSPKSEDTNCEEEFLEENIESNINESEELETNNKEKRKYYDTSIGEQVEEETNAKKLKLDNENPINDVEENTEAATRLDTLGVASIETQEEKPEETSQQNSETEEASNCENVDENYEKSVIDGCLIQEALQNSMAALWNKTSTFALTTVDENSEEYSSVKKLFSETSRGITIKKLERVENPFLLAHFLLKLEKMRIEKGTVEERNLFHGTRRGYVDGICKYNFDWRLRGTSMGNKFGQGVYFAPEVSYAWHYTFGENVMILAKVLVANSTIGNSCTIVPPEPYDTTQNLRGTVVVKFEDHDFFPQYVIHY